MLELNIDFVTIYIFFFSSEWIAWYIYEKTFNWKCRTNNLFVQEANSKEKNNRKKTKLFSYSTKRQLIDHAIQTNVQMKLINEENLLIENSSHTKLILLHHRCGQFLLKQIQVTLQWLKKIKTTFQLP